MTPKSPKGDLNAVVICARGFEANVILENSIISSPSERLGEAIKKYVLQNDFVKLLCTGKIEEKLFSKLVLNSNSRRLEIITEFLNRVEITERTDLSDKKIKLLSTVPINTKYNPNLKLDTYYNQDTFNPLKYDFSMSSNEVLIYRIDNTNYIIRIFPIN